MAVQVIGPLVVSDRTAHRARSVGQGGWVVSYLPGRTVDQEAAVGAIVIAEVAAELAAMAGPLGLTAGEALGLALQAPRRLEREEGPAARRHRAIAPGAEVNSCLFE